MARKSGSRLNDTAAVVAIPAFTPESHEHTSKSVRKIDNGYIVTTSSSRDGRYESSEVFTDSPQTLQETNPMQKAVDYMKREGSI